VLLPALADWDAVSALHTMQLLVFVAAVLACCWLALSSVRRSKRMSKQLVLCASGTLPEDSIQGIRVGDRIERVPMPVRRRARVEQIVIRWAIPAIRLLSSRVP